MEIVKSKNDKGIVELNIGADIDDSNVVSGKIELDIENQAYFVDMVNSIFDEGVEDVILNMELVSYIDSSGLWALFEGHKKASQKNGRIILANPTRDVKRVLDITKMSSKILIFESLIEARSYIQENPS